MKTPEFWFVWCEDGGAPRHKHPTEQSAKTEAERLARLNPGTKFCVLRLVGVCVKSDLQWMEAASPDEMIPF